MNEGIVEGGKDTGNTENELAYKSSQIRHGLDRKFVECTGLYIPSPAKGPRETFSLAAPAVFLGAILSTCWGSGMEYGKEGEREVR